MKTYGVRILRLIWGLFLFALGVVLSVQANIGLAPWETLHMGLSNRLGISFGTVVILVGLIILLADVLMGEKIGLGTVLNVVCVGFIIDTINALGVIPMLHSTPLGVLMLLAGLICIALGSYWYIGSGFGAGPRDSLMIALKKRLPRVPVGVVRGGVEGVVLVCGYLLGAKVGLGTVISVFGIGVTIQTVFRLFRFDVRAVCHESLSETALGIWNAGWRRSH